jgi:hypothetical protein
MNKKLLLFLVFLFSVNAFSAVRTWDGGGADSNWQTAANWVGDTAPAANDDLVFPAAAAQFTTNNNYFILTNFNSITLDGNYTIGGNPLRIANSLTVNSGTQAINTAITINGGQTFTGGQGSVTTIAVLSFNSNGGAHLTFDGAGSFGIGLLTGVGPIVKNGVGVVLVAASNNYMGGISIDNGIFIADGNMPNTSFSITSPIMNGNIFGLSGLGGTGTIGSVVIGQGAISAGTLTSPTGILNTGTLFFSSEGAYAVKIGGTTAGSTGHDQLNVTGTVHLNNARLAPIPWGGFRPAIGDSFTILRNDGTDAIDGTFLNAPEGAIFAGALNTAFRITYQGGDGNDVVITRVNRANFDFDGDGRSEVSTFRPSNGTWNALLTSNGANFSVNWGLGTDKLAPADFDGDNKTDLAIFRDGVWWILNSFNGSVTTVQFGLSGDIPVPNDFDGDGRADIAVWRPSDGVWYQLRSLGNQFAAGAFGRSGDLPLIGDFDGDGLGELAVYRPADGVWHLLMSATAAYVAFPFGIATDRPCAADYDGDGKTDPCVFRGTADGNQPDFYILRSSDSSAAFVSWGLPEDVPMLGDYDGDGKTDIGIFRPGSHDWYWLRSSNASVGISNFGEIGDLSIPSAFVP